MMHSSVKTTVATRSGGPKFRTCLRGSASVSTSRLSIEVNEPRRVKSLKEMPGPRCLPILGTAWQFLPPFNKNYNLAQLHHVAMRQYLEYGPIWKEVFPGHGTTVNIMNAEDVQKVLSVDGKYPERFNTDSMTKYRQDRIMTYETIGVGFGKDEDWWRVRSKSQQPMLRPQNLALYISAMAQVTRDFVDKIRLLRDEENEVPSNFVNELYKWSFESISLVVLDTRLGCLQPNLPPHSEPSRMIRAANDMFECFHTLDFGIPFWKLFPTKTWRKLTTAQDYFTETASKYITRALDKSNKKSRSGTDTQLTILETLLQRGLSPREVVTVVIDMLLAGIETTSNTAGFFFYLLARNPEKQELLRQEINRVLPSQATPIEATHLNELRYLKACLKETLRIFPANLGINRIVKEDVVLSGYLVPKGTRALCMNQVASRLDKYYPQPDAFLPERWIKGNELERHDSLYASLPFGFGIRSCIGRRIAEQEIYLLTIKVLQNFRIEYHHVDIDTIIQLANVPDQPLRFKFLDLS